MGFTPNGHRVRLVTGAAVAALALGALPAAAVAAPPAHGAAYTEQHHGSQPHRSGMRRIVLQGALNVRDLGGYRTWGGDAVRYGVAYRGDALSKLTDADVTKLAGLGLGKVIDYRVPAEIRFDGPDRLPAGLAVTPRPIDDSGLFERMMAAVVTGDPVQQEAALGGGRGVALMRQVYRTLVSDPANSAAFAATFRDLASGSSRSPVLFHCTAGKDRTGWTSYVLLRALGVPERAARGDYLASNGFRAAHDAKVRAGLKQSGLMQNPDLLIPLQEVRDDYLDTALAEAESRYGSLYGYLTKGLGLDLRTLAGLRDRLVD
ncbi:tyrosine-protein phosphatase [Streptomyces sp. NPDC058657]|uniref:tyrosine-protein phosphatase n=1 Tax=unclassified Streptomyces TaxID=2593676 RepID=UPI003654CCD3